MKRLKNSSVLFLHALRILVLSALSSALISAFSSTAQAAVWPLRAQWDEAAEQRYSQWVSENFHAHFFYEGGDYADIATDCADAAYGMRLVFAYENGLPFVFHSVLGERSDQAMNRFDHLPRGLPRVRAFMNWVMERTSTSTLALDTYPVAVNREQIRPGIIYLTWRTHAMQVIDVLPTGVIRYLESTAPRAIRPMRSILGFPHHVPADPKAAATGDGFRRFKQPADYGKVVRNLPGYGEEQFHEARRSGREALPFYEWMQSKLATEPEPLEQLAHRSMFSICAMVYDRANAIEEAQTLSNYLRVKERRCMNAQEADDHSTPLRDTLMLRAMEHLPRLTDRIDWPQVKTKYRGFVELMTGRLENAQVAATRSALLEWCDVSRLEGGPESPVDLRELFDRLKAKRMSSNPQHSIAQRWGEVNAVARSSRVSQFCRG